jgi:TonB-linked SusC/RagA family outer membrane protein
MRNPLSQYANSYYHTWGHIQNQGPWSLAYNQDGQIYVGYDNPVAEISLNSGYRKTDWKVITPQFNAEWNVYGVKGLSLKAGGNYRFGIYDIKSWQKTAEQYDLSGAKGPDFPVSLSYGSQNYREWTLQFFADYKRSFLDETHNVSATFGYEQNYAFNRYFSATRKNYVFMIDQMGAGPSNTMANSGSEAENGRAGFVGVASYNFKRKYYFNGSFRRDGSDLFPKDKRWGTFFAGTVAYAISEEPFFQPLKDKNILNYFKIRAAYGQVGLDSGVSAFSYLTSYGLTERGYVLNGQIVPTFSEGNLISPDITWYTSDTYNVAFDFNTLGERLGGTFEYFYMRTKGYLTSPSNVAYTDPLGLSLPQVKSEGEHRRAGYEASLSWKDHAGKLSYELGANFTYFDQLVAVAWNEDLASQKNPYKRAVQQKGYYTTGFRNLGYYANSDDVLNTPRREGSFDLVAGDIKYKDMNGDGMIDANDQYRIGKNSFPRGNYGIFANLGYKGFFANILFQGATSRDLYLDSVVRGQDTGGYTFVYPYQSDYWMPDNRNAKFPRAAMNANVNGNNNYQTSDFWLVNGRYIRLKSAQVGYNFRDKLLRNIKWLYKMELILSGQNLFTLSPATKYGFDPENGSTNNYDYPVTRTYSISLNLGF